MKLAGSLFTLLGCLTAALRWTRIRRTRLDALDRLTQALAHMEAEITARAVPLPELISRLAETSDGAAGRFFCTLLTAFERLGEQPFAALWTESVQNSLPELRPGERAVLVGLGDVLGRYPVARQQEALARCRAALEESLERARKSEQEDSRLVWGLALSTGALILIVLI